MAFVLKDRVRVISATTGTGPVTLGAAVASAAKGYFRSFSAAGVANDDTVPYMIEDGANWETGIGTYSAGVLTRTTVLNNSAGTTAPISLSGSAEVAIVLTEAAMAMKVDASGIREELQSPRTYYVNPSGNDSNDGLSSGAPFATIQKALTTAQTLDLSIFDVTIQLANGTYSAGGTISGQQVGTGKIIVKGNAATPANVIVSTTSGNCFTASDSAILMVQDLEMRTTTGGNCLEANGGASLSFSNVRFGPCAGRHIQAAIYGRVTGTGNYTISGGAIDHAVAYGASITCQQLAITLSGTPAFSGQFLNSTLGSSITFGGGTFTGSATGKRYNVATCSIINMWGAGASAVPGNSAGSAATGGQYV